MKCLFHILLIFYRFRVKRFYRFLFALNIRLFIKPINLLPGGLSGVSLLIQQLCIKTFGFEPPYAVINLVLNLFPIYIGFRFIGKKFTFLSCIVVVLSSIFVDLIYLVNILNILNNH